ncbi:MAG: arylformamidase [Planctomycetes bacterium]|nr:arylformamidase [Planctomycetota bacterium]
MSRIYDISEPLSERNAVFPGDTPFTREWVMRMRDGASCNVSTIRMSVHCGTHADAPLHYAEDGADAASLDLGAYLGPCRVVELRGAGAPPVVPAAALTAELLRGVTRLLVKTAPVHAHERFDPGFTALGPEAADVLVRHGVRLVGLDAQSMDCASAKHLVAHQRLRRGGVAILENLDLSAVPPGEYELIALPLRIVGADAAPVRAVLRTLDARHP